LGPAGNCGHGPLHHAPAATVGDPTTGYGGQWHSRDYQRPNQLPGTGAVAVVGEVAIRPCKSRPTWLQPAAPYLWLLTTRPRLCPIIRSCGPSWCSRACCTRACSTTGHKLFGRPNPVVSADLEKLRRFANADIGRARSSLTTRQAHSSPARATSPPLDAVVWATGYRPDYGWIDLPIFEPDGSPRHHRGITAAPGVAFLGIDWLDSRRSALLHGAGGKPGAW
ncbi:MAG: hypothetical protein WKG07_33645, partial [Hymenobacter sp.]